MSTADPIGGCQAVERALGILRLFDERTTELSVADVALALGVHRSTASRLLAALARHGLLEQGVAGGHFRLGLALVSLGGMVLNRFPVRAGAHRVLRELRDATGETAYLGLLDGREVVYIDQASSPRVTVNVDWVGCRQSLTESVSGRLLLAYQPAELAAELGSVAPETLAGGELALIRRRVYALRFDESEDGVAGVAAPVRDYSGAVVASISVGGPRFRIDRERLESELVPAVLRAASDVSEALGSVAA
ncbi:MAG: IclR family transcriptional regulator [Gaiellaceae bacterium]